MSRLSMDIDFNHQRRWSGRPASVASRSWLLFISPGLRLLLIHRITHLLCVKRKEDIKHKWLWLLILSPFCLLKSVTKIGTKSYISHNSELDNGISFSDKGYIIFGPKKTGGGTVIGTRVTVGMSHTDNGCPEIGRNVWIGSDYVIYGAITIGDGATLLPNTVLTKSIPAGVVMQGNPARLVLRNFDNTELRKRQDIDAVQYVNAQREQLGG
jgi:serine acetyltransferase